MPSMPSKCWIWSIHMFLLFLILHVLFSGANNTTDTTSLLRLRDSLNQKADLIPSWFDAYIPPCNWSGIACEDSLVHTINLSDIPFNIPVPSFEEFSSLRVLNISNCGFSGRFLSNIGNLLHLQYLDLSYNILQDSIPLSIFNLTMLKELVINSNRFSGTLMHSVGQLTELTKLDLSFNAFSGRLPSAIGNLKNLKYLDVNSNDLGGNLPSSLRNLTKLQYFDISYNGFNGSIFKEIGNLVELLTLDLSHNSLTGHLPREIGRLKGLQYLFMGSNFLSGNIPHEIGSLVQLKVIDLEECQLTGRIPEEISNLRSLTHIIFTGNSFEGGLPDGIGELTNLTSLVATKSGLGGRIPEQIGNCFNLEILSISFNSFSGSLPDSLAGLQSLLTFMADGNQLSGSIPSWISNWKNIATLSLSKNLFSGSLPPVALESLVSYSVDANELTGELPANICGSKSLNTLSLLENNITGRIGSTFKNCSSLTNLVMGGNKFHGEIPGYLGNLPLILLDLGNNNFSGSIPDQLLESSTLLELTLSSNQLESNIPENIGGISSLRRLLLDNNRLEGSIPKSIGKLNNLTELSLHGNKLGGNIPPELFNCESLITLDLGSNYLTGPIPKAISQLLLLDNLVLSDNKLSGNIPPEICSGFQKAPLSDYEFVQHHGMLDLSNNQLEGQIPKEISKCAVVTELKLQGNKLNGSIPLELAHIKNLTLVDLSSNFLSGPILSNHSVMKSLQGLLLSNNCLSGFIPEDLSSMFPSLVKLNLSTNQLTGDFPSSAFDMKSLAEVDVGQNDLHGSIHPPKYINEGSTSLLFLNASNNHLSGGIGDGALCNFTSLAVLDLHNNHLTGNLPSCISNLVSLTYLDISNNLFQDSVPCDICTMTSLSFINFSGNQLTSYAPKICYTSSMCSVILAPMTTHHPPRSLNKASVCGISFAVSAIVVLFLYGVLKWQQQRQMNFNFTRKANPCTAIEPSSTDGLLSKKLKEPLSINIATFEHSLLRLTLSDIETATDNFSKLHIIGDGGFGTVYKASLPEKMVAVKRLHSSGHFQGDREFLAEMETIGKVNHRNLVPLLGYCVFNDERFLIYDFMENGSLDLLLRNNADAVEVLGWPVRLKICLGSARGLAFLHHGFVPHIIHRDMKSSNILLDKEFEPRVSDFGLARIISACESHVSTDLAGTFGYIPPEYGQAMKATAKGDIYSFGVIVLELLTGRPPVGQEEKEGGGNLVGWVRWMVEQGKRDEMFYTCFPPTSIWRKQMLKVLTVAMSCTSDEPWKRPRMLEVVKVLKDIKALED